MEITLLELDGLKGGKRMAETETSCTNCVHQPVCYIHRESTKLFIHNDSVRNAIEDMNTYAYIAQYCKYFTIEM